MTISASLAQRDEHAALTAAKPLEHAVSMLKLGPPNLKK
jgi:hypothetical protein